MTYVGGSSVLIEGIYVRMRRGDVEAASACGSALWGVR